MQHIPPSTQRVELSNTWRPEPPATITDLCVLDREVHCEKTGRVFRPWLKVDVDLVTGKVLAWDIVESNVAGTARLAAPLPRSIYGRVERQLHQFNERALALPGKPLPLSAVAAAARAFFGVEQTQG